MLTSYPERGPEDPHDADLPGSPITLGRTGQHLHGADIARPLRLPQGGCGRNFQGRSVPTPPVPGAQTSQPTRLPRMRREPPWSRLCPFAQSFSGPTRSHRVSQSPLARRVPGLPRARRCARPQTTGRGEAAGSAGCRPRARAHGERRRDGRRGRTRAPGMRVPLRGAGSAGEGVRLGSPPECGAAGGLARLPAQCGRSAAIRSPATAAIRESKLLSRKNLIWLEEETRVVKNASCGLNF